MAEILSAQDIDALLHSEVLGRLGCAVGEKVYVVPVNYGYDGKYIYAHSKEGLKVQMMRKNHNVCFQVDRSDDNGCWRSVIVYGKYEELLTVKAQKTAMKIFSEQMARLISNPQAMPSHGIVKGPDREKDPFKSVVFRIAITEVTGRCQDMRTQK